MAAQPGLCQTWSEYGIVGFVTQRLILANLAESITRQDAVYIVDLSEIDRLIVSIRS